MGDVLIWTGITCCAVSAGWSAWCEHRLRFGEVIGILSLGLVGAGLIAWGVLLDMY